MMEIRGKYRAMDMVSGIRLSLTSLTRVYKNDDGTVQKKTIRAGDPEFDSYVAEQKRQREEAAAALPRNFMRDGVAKDGTSATRLGQKIATAFVCYYDGTLDLKGLESTVQDVVSNLRTSYIDKGFEPEEFMPQLLENVYFTLKVNNIHGVSERNFKDSRALAAYYNGSDWNSRDVYYYDAKYYYQSEEMKGTIREMMQKIAKQYDVDASDVEFREGFKDGSVQKGIYSSYNTSLNEHARNDFLIGSMIDETMVPPKGFKFFYKGNERGTNNYTGIPSSDGTPESAFDGILHIWYGDWSYTGRVPVRQDASRFPVSVNMYDHVSQNRTDIPQAIVPMLKNFDFFTVYLSGRYAAAHPRKF